MRTGTKKFVSVGMTVVYLHVNVLCAAPIGASPEPATAANSVRRFLTGALQPRQKPDPVFSFHADPIVPVPPPVERPARER